MKRQKIRKAIIFISFLLFPATFYYLSPYLIIDGTLNGIITGSFLFFTLLFISSLFLGRAFCGWLCPAGGAQDIILDINGKKIRKGNIIKWMIWIPWVSVIVILAVKNGGYHTVDPFYQTTYGFSIGNVYALITYLLVLMLIVVPAFIFGRRSFCHSICWMAPFMIIGRKIRNLIKLPALQLSSQPSTCVHCHSCTNTCPMSLPVEDMVTSAKMENTECVLCGKCVDGCKSGSIRYEFGRQVKNKRNKDHSRG
jgi:ferredoxin-type protein NapH